MTSPHRITRKRPPPPDALLYPGAAPWESAIGLALKPFDETARQMDRKWGHDRLPALVPPEMAARYGVAINHMNDRIEANDADGAVAAIANAIRGLQAMDQAATAASAVPADPRIVTVDAGGLRFAILTDDAAWPIVREQYPGLPTYTLAEIGQIVKHHAMPGATQHITTTALAPPPATLPEAFWDGGGDPIPF